jgi:uridine phosphorylase
MSTPPRSPSALPLIRPCQLFKNIRVEPQALVVFSPSHLSEVLTHVSLVSGLRQTLGFSTLQSVVREGRRFTLAGPALGAPLSAMVLEVLIAFGTRQVIGFGPCGSLTNTVRIGDVVIPTQAYSDEGTSAHYPMGAQANRPTPRIVQALQHTWSSQDKRYALGKVWTTDAPFRETPERIAKFRAKHAIAVEMELSALFRVGRFYDVETGAVLVVSDELFALRWNPGYNNKVFKRSFRDAAEMVCDFVSNLS